MEAIGINAGETYCVMNANRRKRGPPINYAESPPRKKSKADPVESPTSASKRQASKTSAPLRKIPGRSRTNLSQGSEDCEVEKVLDKKTVEGEVSYLLQWKGINPVTGEQWLLDWIPESGCNQETIDLWEKRGSEIESQSSSGASGLTGASQLEGHQVGGTQDQAPIVALSPATGLSQGRKLLASKGARVRRYIESSPEPSTHPGKPESSVLEGANHETSLVRVNVPGLPDDFLRDDYRFVHGSQFTDVSRSAIVSDSISPTINSPGDPSLRVIPDSQSLLETPTTRISEGLREGTQNSINQSPQVIDSTTHESGAESNRSACAVFINTPSSSAETGAQDWNGIRYIHSSSLAQAPSQIPVNLQHSPSIEQPQTPPSKIFTMSQQQSSPATQASAVEKFRDRMARAGIGSAKHTSISPSRQTTSKPISPLRPSSTHDALNKAIGAAPSAPQLVTSSMVNGLYLPVMLQGPVGELYDSILQQLDEANDSQDVTHIVEQVFDACNHPDLLNDLEPTQAMGPNTQSHWSTTMSPKFAFLKTLIENARNVDKRIILFVKPGRLIGITETFLRGLGVKYERPDMNRHAEAEVKSALRLTLLSTETDGPQLIHERADLVIGLDETFSNEDIKVQTARGQYHVNEVCPSLCLVVPNSAEHVLRAKFGTTGERDAKSILAQAKGLVDELGKSTSVVSAADLGEQVARAFAQDSTAMWEALPQLDLKSLRNGSTASGAKATDRPQKRSHETSQDSSDGEMTKKKPRTAGLPGRISPMDETMDLGTSTTRIDETTQTDSSIEELISSRLEASKLRRQYAELENSLGDLQTRFEDQTKANELLAKQASTDELLIATAEARREAQFATIAGLRAERLDLRNRLEAAQQAAPPAAPDTAEIDELRTQAARIRQLEKRIETLNKDLDYIRTSYQTARSEATSRGEEVDRLRAENEELSRKASGEQARLYALFTQQAGVRGTDEAKRARLEAQQLRDSLQTVAAENRRLKEELETERERRGMGAATRSSSLPPRGPVGAALKGAVSLSVHGGKGRRAIASANASRANSEAPGFGPLGSVKTSPLQRTLELDD